MKSIMKKSKLDFTRQDLNTTFDLYSMCLGRNGSGKGDSIGRTYMAMITWRDVRFMVWRNIRKCWKDGKLYRHPDYREDTMSRDHVFNYYMIMYELYKGIKKKVIVDTIKCLPRPFKPISNMKNSNMLPCLWAFIRALHFKHKAWYRFLYYTWNLHLIFTFTWDKLCLRFKWYKLLGFRIYALHNLAWQLNHLRGQRNSFINKLLTRLVMWYNEPSNYAIRLICGDKTVKKEDVEAYQGRVNNRWTCDPDRTERDMSKRTGEDVLYNNLDRDYLIALYERVNNKH